MPNWIYNEVEIEFNDPKADSLAILKSVSDDNDEFDFGKVIPEPDDLKDGMEAYDWHVANWGIKWNASDTSVIDNREGWILICFNTPWGTPKPVIVELAKKLEATVKCSFYDEDFGCNCGKYEVNSAGETVSEEYYPSDGLEFIEREFGEAVMEDHGYVQDDDGSWVYED